MSVKRARVKYNISQESNVVIRLRIFVHLQHIEDLKVENYMYVRNMKRSIKHLKYSAFYNTR